MSTNRLTALAGALLGLVFLWTGAGCGGTTTGNGEVDLSFTSDTGISWLEWLFIPPAYAQVSNTSLCLSRLRFKADSSDSSDVSGNVDFKPGKVTLQGGGTSIGAVTVPVGSYERIEFDIKDDCGNGHSVYIGSNNASPGGPVSTTDSITIKFFGSFTVDEAQESLALALGSILTTLDNTANGADLKDALEDAGVSGSF